ncbi:MAG: UPF0182 family protein [Desulfobacterales bacterium]|jgi:uncharacterized membrane protein (UPF0182 family)
MKTGKRRLLILLATLAALAAAYVVFVYTYLGTVIDYWWFSSLGYGGYFILRLVYRYLVFVAITLLFFLIFFLNFRVASRHLADGATTPEAGKSKKKPLPDLFRMFRTGSMIVYAPLSLVMAVFVAYPAFGRWESFLFFGFGSSAGTVDPTYGKDIAFYLFSLPIWRLLQERLLLAMFLLLLATGLLYGIQRKMLHAEQKGFPRGARVHLNLLALLLVALQGWSFLLQRYELLYDTTHMPLFFGPGYTQMTVTLPLIWATFVTFLMAAGGLFFLVNFRKGWIPAVVFLALFAAAFGLRQTQALPDTVQKYLVDPNELTRETPYIRRSIQATLAAYALQKVETREFTLEPIPRNETKEAIQANIRDIPVWDSELLDEVYDQVQGIRPYYNFTGVDVDRYEIGGRLQQVNLAAREINLEKLADYAKKWTNRRLQYTHGYGVVMTPAAQRGEEGMRWFIEGISPRSEEGLRIENPGIYYGLSTYDYAIAPNEMGEMDYPKEDGFVSSNYEGKAGVPLTSLFRKLAFSLYFKDRNLFFTTKTTKKSRVLFRRNIQDAASRLTPFFVLDKDPYVVVTAKNLFWIQDAYTTSSWYPNAAPFDGSSNYIRSAVKIVVNAYGGEIRYYISDRADPIVSAYARMYPGLLRPLSDMPEELRRHIRYPKDIFKIQMQMFKKYHQTDPATFYRQEDAWELAEQPKSGRKGVEPQPMEPYYLTLNLIDKNRREFLLLSPMSPKNRPNLRALVIAACDEDRYGKIYLYSFPKGEQVYGPDQISALIDQDTTIAEQFTLWDQAGSEVQRGRMIILPIGNAVFYIQPVYLSAASRLKIPQLQRLIVSHSEVVVMDRSLETAFEEVALRLERRRSTEVAPFPALPQEKQEKAPPQQAPNPAPSAETGKAPALQEESTSK